MASTGSVSLVKPRTQATFSGARSTGSVTLYSSRSGQSSMSYGVKVTERANESVLMPRPEHPLGRVRQDGTVVIDRDWDKFLRYLWETKIGGYAAKSLPDVATTVVAAQNTANKSAAEVSAIGQQTQANAEALSVVVQVAQNNALTGADQIPPVRLSPGENIP